MTVNIMVESRKSNIASRPWPTSNTTQKYLVDELRQNLAASRLNGNQQNSIAARDALPQIAL